MVRDFFSYAFRPFFLANSSFAVLAILIWVVLLNGGQLGLEPLQPMLWHGHEMLIGFALATIAGFVLTAVATWTKRPPVQGAALVCLVLAWLVGRGAMLLPAGTPYIWVAVPDMLFPLLLVALIAREIVSGGSRRNYPIILISLLFAGLNGLYHAGAGGILPGMERAALFLLIHLVLLLITVIAGRIIPNFTANWMRSRNKPEPPANRPLVDRLALALTLLVGLAVSVAPLQVWTAVLAFAAAVAHTLRLSGWRGRATAEEPLLFVLHVAYAWLPLGYALTGLAALGVAVTPGAALHALTMGAIGVMILAVTSRVALAHTGRALHASRLTVLSYVILNVAVVVRVFGPLLPIDYQVIIDSAALGWLISFGLFVWVYGPVLTGPRNPGN